MELNADGGRYSTAFTASALAHVGALLLLAIGARMLPAKESASATARPAPPNGIVWVSGDAARGGGGGPRSSGPARRIEMRGSDALSLPVIRSTVQVAADTQMKEPEVQPLELQAVGMARGLENRPGVLTAAEASSSESLGPGSGPGPGVGLGDGPGVGRGQKGGWGGEVYQGGNGVTHPVLLREVRPRYTEPAMRARVQGIVELDAVVMPDGRVGSLRIVRSLDRTFGLDQEAIDAAKQWRFMPGRRAGVPVAVLVRIELTFTLQ